MGKLISKCRKCGKEFTVDKTKMPNPLDDPRVLHLRKEHNLDTIRLGNNFETTKLGNWHREYLEGLEKELTGNPRLKKKYRVRNSNAEKLYLPYWKGIKRNEILSNPDMLLENKDHTPEYILELEYNINYKKLVGIALLTDMAVGLMKTKKKPKLILITRKEFPNSEFIEKEIKAYIRNTEFKLLTTDTFNSSLIA